MTFRIVAELKDSRSRDSAPRADRAVPIANIGFDSTPRQVLGLAHLTIPGGFECDAHGILEKSFTAAAYSIDPIRAVRRPTWACTTPGHGSEAGQHYALIGHLPSRASPTAPRRFSPCSGDEEVQALVADDEAGHCGSRSSPVTAEALAERANYIVAVGGDGTLLQPPGS